MSGKQPRRLFLGILIAGLFVWLISRQVNSEELQNAFDGTTLTWVVAGFLAFAVDYTCRIERWRLMLVRDNPTLTWRRCAGPLLGSFAANNVLPFRAGDVLRAFAFNGRLEVTSGIVVATLFVERLLDLLMVVVLLGAVMALFGLDLHGFAGIGSAALLGVGLGILLLLLFPGLFAPLARMLGRITVRLAPGPGLRLLDEIEKSLMTLAHLARGDTMIRLVAWSLAAWLMEGGVFWCAGKALTSITNPAAGWLALPVGTLATLIPSTPGYVGTFDYFTVRAMVSLGNDIAAATAYALLVHAMLWLPPTLIGGLYLLFCPTNPKIN